MITIEKKKIKEILDIKISYGLEIPKEIKVLIEEEENVGKIQSRSGKRGIKRQSC